MILVALGGNALLQHGEKPSIAAELRNAETAVHHLAPLLANKKLVITHGNGPQVGAILLRSELAKNAVYALPLAVCNAESEGEIGYILEQAVRNVFLKKKIRREVASLVTLVEVGKNDPAFRKPTKPIGPFYTKKQAVLLARKGMSIINDSGRGYRRVVASPKPVRIIGSVVIEKLARAGIIVIASGGGGIPVISTKNRLQGIDAVIDKDYASARLAHDIDAAVFIMVTDVPCVYLNYGTTRQKKLLRLTVADAKKYLRDGQFSEGSMKPKIEAAISFLTDGNHRARKALIVSITDVEAAIHGIAGTTITR